MAHMCLILCNMDFLSEVTFIPIYPSVLARWYVIRLGSVIHWAWGQRKNRKIPRVPSLLRYQLGCPPSQDSSGKWRFRLGFPTKNVIILVVTVTGRGDNPRYQAPTCFDLRNYHLGGGFRYLLFFWIFPWNKYFGWLVDGWCFTLCSLCRCWFWGLLVVGQDRNVKRFHQLG